MKAYERNLIEDDYKFLRLKWSLIISIFIKASALGQGIYLQGYIEDGITYERLESASVIATPIDDISDMEYSISDNRGGYSLELLKKVTYKVEVFFIGYDKVEFEFYSEKNEKKILQLFPAPKQLKEVVLNYKIPIEVKEDTITYQTDAFVNGTERKLREVLKKLPGIEVDREGNVMAQGRKVTKVLVEDETFFTGNSKLAVNNIPADAVDQVQVLDNYNEIGFLKGLQDSDDLALNIKLKEDKKKFAFGDIETAGGVEDRYLLHPNLFYYSPDTKINFIGDLNNLGIKSFTLSDYIEFNGGFGKLIGDVRSYLTLSNDDFSQFLINNDFKANVNRFGAFNLRQALSPNTDINSFVIANGSTTQTEQQTLNTYNAESGLLDENRNQQNNLDNFFILGKITLDYEPNRDADLSVNTFVKLTKNEGNGQLLTQNSNQETFFNTASNLDAIDLTQNIAFSKRFSPKQTLSFESTISYKNNKPNNNWQTDQPFLPGLVPLIPDTAIEVQQLRETETISFDAVLKDYWVLNNYNHVYTTLGTNLVFEDYLTQSEQLLANGTRNDFSLNGFGNSIDYSLNDTFLGLEYKFLAGIFTVKSSVVYHNYLWNNTQAEQVVRNSTKAILPAFNAEAELNSSEKLRFRYQQRYRFPRSNRLANNFVLRSFNAVTRGNAQLQNQRNHSYSLSYYKFSLFRGLNLNAGLFYNRTSQSVKNTTALEGINQFVTYTMFNQPENSVRANFRFSKKINTIKLGVDTNTNYSEFFQLVNDNVSKNISRSYTVKATAETFFENWPNVEFGYSYQPSVFTTAVNRNRFSNTELSVNLDYVFLKDFHVKADYRRTQYENEGQNLTNIFNLANASLFYQKEDSPWGFELGATNIFNVRFKRSNSFSDFLISDQTTFIIPRILMIKVAYKL